MIPSAENSLSRVSRVRNCRHICFSPRRYLVYGTRSQFAATAIHGQLQIVFGWTGPSRAMASKNTGDVAHIADERHRRTKLY